MFSNFFLKSFRILLIPFSLLFWIGLGIRYWLYEKRIIKSDSFGLPVICIGNLSVGGTGKSPMVEYLVERLKDRYKVATLSRGYKRKTRGYALANENSTALEIGDEPMQFHLKFPDVPVSVGEKRIEAIPQLLHDRPDIQAIILDDAFQHRQIKAGMNIILTDLHNLYTRDFYLPTGDLRDLKISAKKADIIVVTKCEPDLSNIEKDRIKKELNPLPEQHIFFTSIKYGDTYHIKAKATYIINETTEVLLVTGIANPKPLKKMLEKQAKSYHMMQFPDHHIFGVEDLREIRKRYSELESRHKIILTTEKDAMRLVKFQDEIAQLPLFILPIRHHFLFNEGESFNNLVINFIQNFKRLDQ